MKKFATLGGDIELRDGSCDELVFDEVYVEDVYRLQDFDQRLGVIRGLPALDLGANVGAFSLRALELGASRVHALEPHPENAARLRHNAAVTGFGDRVNVHERAVIGGEDPAALVLINGDDRFPTISYQAHEGQDGLVVRTVSIDAVLGLEPEWGLLKCDVEGAEFAIFEGASLALLDHVRGVTLEFHGPGMGQHCEWIPQGSLGRLVEKLSEWGHVQVLGAASRGGQIYASRY